MMDDELQPTPTQDESTLTRGLGSLRRHSHFRYTSKKYFLLNEKRIILHCFAYVSICFYLTTFTLSFGQIFSPMRPNLDLT